MNVEFATPPRGSLMLEMKDEVPWTMGPKDTRQSSRIEVRSREGIAGGLLAQAPFDLEQAP